MRNSEDRCTATDRAGQAEGVPPLRCALLRREHVSPDWGANVVHRWNDHAWLAPPDDAPTLTEAFGVPADPMAALTAALAQHSEMHKRVLEAAMGVRSNAEAAGFSPTVAEQMAAVFYLQCFAVPSAGTSA